MKVAQQLSEQEGIQPAPRQFGTLAGVFAPTLLTILGVIMYLRLPWVVGNGGLLGGTLIIAIAVGITTATGLSLSSIATNTRRGNQPLDSSTGSGSGPAPSTRDQQFEHGDSLRLPPRAHLRC